MLNISWKIYVLMLFRCGLGMMNRDECEVDAKRRRTVADMDGSGIDAQEMRETRDIDHDREMTKYSVSDTQTTAWDFKYVSSVVFSNDFRSDFSESDTCAVLETAPPPSYTVGMLPKAQSESTPPWRNSHATCGLRIRSQLSSTGSTGSRSTGSTRTSSVGSVFSVSDAGEEVARRASESCDTPPPRVPVAESLDTVVDLPELKFHEDGTCTLDISSIFPIATSTTVDTIKEIEKNIESDQGQLFSSDSLTIAQPVVCDSGTAEQRLLHEEQSNCCHSVSEASHIAGMEDKPVFQFPSASTFYTSDKVEINRRIECQEGEVHQQNFSSDSKLDLEEEKKVKEFVEQVVDRESNNTSVTRSTAVKFLMARKFDVNRAVSLYFQHEEVRRLEGISQVDPTQIEVKRELLTEKFTVLPSRDCNGAAIALFTARYHHPALTTHQATLKALVFQLDAALESLETQRNGLVFIYDMTQSKYVNFDYDLSIKILNMLKGAFPARLKKVLIVTAPLWFKAPFKILRLFVREKLRDRVYTVTHPQLERHIALNALPRRLGGTMELNHRQWIANCLKLLWTKNTQIDNDIASYFENMENTMMPELSIYSLSSSVSTPPSSPEGSLAGFHSSEIESEGSKGTVSEKHNHEYREKELDNHDMDTSENSNTHSVVNSPVFESQSDSIKVASLNEDSDKITSLSDVKSIPCKRGSDTSPSEIVPGEQTAPALPRKKKAQSMTVSKFEDSIHMPESGGYSIKEFMDYTRIKGRQGLIREYEQIKATPPKGSFDASKSTQNLPKNRYTDVLCFDHSRVKLSQEESDSYSDYINANYVDGYRQKAAYISTQGPLPRTFDDFWRMVWEQMVLLVVMTTRTVERGRLKCGQYWPYEELTKEEYGDFVVTNKGIDRHDSYIVTSLMLQHTKSGQSREITHFQFISWPDYGVPHSAEAFLDFMLHVRRTQAERTRDLDDKWSAHQNGPPIAIHCSAGIGRTGTFITMDILTRRLADIGSVDVHKTVEKIRSQRAFSIQMPDQYVFIHLALLEHAHREGILEHLNLDGFDDSSSESD